MTGQYEKQLKYVSPSSRINDYRQRLMYMEEQIDQLVNERLQEERHRLALYSERLSGLSPLKQLERGYAFVQKEDGQGVHSVRDTKTGETIYVRLVDGALEAVVSQLYNGKGSREDGKR